LTTSTTRCDLHLHSSASLTTGQWFSQYFQAPESYADPLRQYELCKTRGMTLVTLTDHDSIEGGLQLMGHRDFFLSVEVSTRFPENDCAVHVLVFNLTPKQHTQLQRRRDSVYKVSSYLRSEGLAHSLPHPLLSPNWKLDAITLEKCLALFPAFERANGLTDRRADGDMAHFFGSITPELLGSLSAKHGIDLAHGTPPRLVLTAGSDDHGHRRCGTLYTETDGTLGAEAFLASVMDGRARTVGSGGDLNAMATCIKQASYAHFREGNAGERARRNPFVDVMDVLAGRSPASDAPPGRGASDVLDSLLRAARKAGVASGPELDITIVADVPSDAGDRAIVDAVARTSDALAETATRELGSALLAFDIYGMLASLTDLAAALGVASPLLFAADHFARQDVQRRAVWKDWDATARPRVGEHLAVFSDVLGNFDGVSTWCKQFGQRAAAAGKRVWFAACDAEGHIAEADALPRSFPALARFKVPLYPGIEICIPSLAATVDRLWREGITHVEIATPGPMGLVGLAAARILRLPVTATYHTDFSGLIGLLIDDPKLVDVSRAYLGWFYRNVDRTFVFSEVSREKLLQLRVPPETIDAIDMAVDPSDFSPTKQSPSIFAELGVPATDRPIVLSVGRLSLEKNVDVIVDAVRALQSRSPAPMLVVVGDGPAAVALKRRSRDEDFVCFVGFRSGRVLRELFASASSFVFASRVDSLGLVNLEALASGIPVLVPQGSAITESLSDGHDAIFFDDGPEGLKLALGALLDDPQLAADLASNGRQRMLSRWQEVQFEAVWNAMAGAVTSVKPA
jgi:glycosyltransferase involved in cell wall biosynthesis